MKRRIRKKLRLGEFKQFCFEVKWKYIPLDYSQRSFEYFTDKFIEFVEKLEFSCCGGMSMFNKIYEGNVVIEHEMKRDPFNKQWNQKNMIENDRLKFIEGINKFAIFSELKVSSILDLNSKEIELWN